MNKYMYADNKYKNNKYTIEELENEIIIDTLNNNLKTADWDLISCYQELTEEFIAKYKNKLNWNWISQKQKLTEEFIVEYKNKVYWYWIFNRQNLSEEFKSKYNKYRNCWII
jgi:hypothetical protein